MRHLLRCFGASRCQERGSIVIQANLSSSVFSLRRQTGDFNGSMSVVALDTQFAGRFVDSTLRPMPNTFRLNLR